MAVRKYIQFAKERDEGTGEILEILLDKIEKLEDKVRLLSQNCSCTVKERMSGHRTGCTVPEMDE